MSSANTSLISKEQFDEGITYLSKAKDLGRTPNPAWVFALIMLLVFVVGLIFPALLGDWTIPGASQSQQLVVGIAMGFICTCTMTALSHIAGRAYYRTSILRSCFKEFKQNGVNYLTKSITLDVPQNIDDNEPPYVQTVNRVANHVSDKGSYAICIVAIVYIAFMVTCLTYMREQSLKRELTEQIWSEAGTVNPFDPLADEIEEPLNNTCCIEEASVDITPFWVILFIFINSQIVSAWAGYKYGFAGRESKLAYKITRQYKSQQ